eukprot:TRINITY_DN11414_c0_g1_i1.p1 TRINITY_DN11414_c0_g1~~TRINITY_DN11414_c0_g1_i1.p1  ORF type:complete len:173 (+),score=33.28 TRINITY_DN11414_c0_g1_i1:96-614(+)
MDADELQHVELMRLAFIQAERALAAGEVPIGCVIVHKGKPVATGYNRTNELKNGTLHAEIVAIDSLQASGGVPLSECALYVTVEPCIMCAAALSLAGIHQVYFGCHNERFGGIDSVFGVVNRCESLGLKPYKCVGGLLKSDAIALLKRFYENSNPAAPVPHRKRPRADDASE